MRALHLTEVLKVLTSLQHVIDASSEIDSLMSVSKYKEAAECMMRARFVIQQPDFNNFDALTGFKKFLQNYLISTFDRMYVILDRFVTFKLDHFIACVAPPTPITNSVFQGIYSRIGSLTVVPLSKPSKPPASFEIASKDVHNMRIRTLSEAIQILGAESGGVEGKFDVGSEESPAVSNRIGVFQRISYILCILINLTILLFCSCWMPHFSSVLFLLTRPVTLLSSSFLLCCAILFLSQNSTLLF